MPQLQLQHISHSTPPTLLVDFLDSRVCTTLYHLGCFRLCVEDDSHEWRHSLLGLFLNNQCLGANLLDSISVAFRSYGCSFCQGGSGSTISRNNLSTRLTETKEGRRLVWRTMDVDASSHANVGRHLQDSRHSSSRTL